MASFLGRGGFLSPGMTGQREVPEMVDPRANPTVGNVTQTSAYPPQQAPEQGGIGGFLSGLKDKMNITPGYFEALGAGIATSTGGNYGNAIAAGNLALGKGRKERSEAKAFMDDMRIQYPQMTQAEYDAGLKSKLVRARLYEQATGTGSKTYQTITGEEAAAMGLDPNKVYNRGSDGKISQVGGSQVSITNEKGESTWAKKVAEGQADILKGAIEQGNVAAGFGADLQRLSELIPSVESGGLVGRASEIYPNFDVLTAEFQSIVNRLAPKMRETGSGSTSDMEMRQYLASLPQLRNMPEANKAIVELMQRKNAIDIERQNIATKAYTDDISREEAIRQINELNRRSILTEQDRALLRKVQGGGGTPAPAPSVNPDGSTTIGDVTITPLEN